MLRSVTDDRVLAYWSTVGEWMRRDRRFLVLGGMCPPEALPLLREGNDFQLRRNGADDRFKGSALVVPAKALRDRQADVLSPAKLAGLHAGYRNHSRMGANWRADVWTILAADPSISASDAARLAGCSFAVAWEVRRDFLVWSDAAGE